ncbi:hypothetical protein Tco_1449403 [Tanacetum coccineum]
MPGRSTTEAIHLLRSLIEKYRERQRDLHLAFIDLEKAYDCVPHDIMLIAESAEELNNKIERWREALEHNGLRVSREKTEYLRCDFGRYDVVYQEVDVRIKDRILQPKESFRYLGSVIHRSGRIDEDVAHRIGVGMLVCSACVACRALVVHCLDCWLCLFVLFELWSAYGIHLVCACVSRMCYIDYKLTKKQLKQYGGQIDRFIKNAPQVGRCVEKEDLFKQVEELEKEDLLKEIEEVLTDFNYKLTVELSKEATVM